MNTVCKILLMITIEIFITFIFWVIAPKNKKNNLIDIKSILKGLLERAFLTYSLISGFPHSLTLFGALKLGTRLKSPDNEKTEEGRKEEKDYNDYYLLGNFISVTLSMMYYKIIV